MTGSTPQSEIDRLLIQQIARWAVADTIGLILFALAILDSWPFPAPLDPIKGVFYTITGLSLVTATAAITFLGYRIVTLRVARRARAVYLIFLPAAVLLSAVIGFLLLTAPR